MAKDSELESDLQTSFSREGYIHIPGLLDENEVSKLREGLCDRFKMVAEKKKLKMIHTLPPSYCFNDPLIYNLLLTEDVKNYLSNILGSDFELIPDLEVHKNSFGLKKPRFFGLIKSGWHIDSGSEGSNEYLMDPDYKFVKCGLFLQDNTLEYGGGIEVTPGFYKFPIRTGLMKVDFFLRKIIHFFAVLFKSSVLNIKSGDFVAFHSFMPHRGVVPEGAIKTASQDNIEFSFLDLPERKSKYVVYFCACSKGFGAPYLRHAISRSENEVKLENPENSNYKNSAFFSDFAAMKYPDDFSDTFVNESKKLSIVTITNTGKLLLKAKKLLQDAVSQNKFGNIN
tara:strand:+ start:1913 stop:2932 length:1020 start_codon:yes stop_codon:yes gene_type:complete